MDFALKFRMLALTLLLPCSWPVMADETADSSIGIRQLDIFDESAQPRAGICYGPFRNGQAPGAKQPSRRQIAEDLAILAPHWQMLRVYGSDPFADLTCSVIQQQGYDMKVMVGAWLNSEIDSNDRKVDATRAAELTRFKSENEKQVAAAIELANRYPNVVAAISVGNETQVSWSFHPLPAERLIEYVEQVRSQTKVPVSVADDFLYWVTPESRHVAERLDFIVMHGYGMWHSQQLDDSVEFLRDKYKKVKERHPDRLIVIGETGWATERGYSGDEGRLIKGVAGEAEQATYHKSLTDWTTNDKIPLFYFEAFDERWKGGPDPAGVEKHWGLFDSNRQPKLCMQGIAKGAEIATEESRKEAP